MKRVGRLYDKVLVEGNKNELEDHQILVEKIDTNGEEKLELFIRDGAEVKKITDSTDMEGLPEWVPELIEIISGVKEWNKGEGYILGICSDPNNKLYGSLCTFWSNTSDWGFTLMPEGYTFQGIYFLSEPVPSILPEVSAVEWSDITEVSEQIMPYVVCALRKDDTTMDSIVVRRYESVMSSFDTFYSFITTVVSNLSPSIYAPPKPIHASWE